MARAPGLKVRATGTVRVRHGCQVCQDARWSGLSQDNHMEGEHLLGGGDGLGCGPCWNSSPLFPLALLASLRDAQFQ